MGKKAKPKEEPLPEEKILRAHGGERPASVQRVEELLNAAEEPIRPLLDLGKKPFRDEGDRARLAGEGAEALEILAQGAWGLLYTMKGLLLHAWPQYKTLVPVEKRIPRAETLEAHLDDALRVVEQCQMAALDMRQSCERVDLQEAERLEIERILESHKKKSWYDLPYTSGTDSR